MAYKNYIFILNSEQPSALVEGTYINTITEAHPTGPLGLGCAGIPAKSSVALSLPHPA